MTPVDLASEQTPQEGRPEQLANKSIQADDASKLAKDWYKSAAEYLAIENSQHAHPLKPVQYRPGIFVFGIAPQTVRLALICELLLKSLIVFEGKDPKKRHRIDKLYELIDQEDKNAFEQYLEEHGSPWKGKTEKSFSECSNTFVELRYRADSGTQDNYSCHWPFLKTATGFLDNYVYEKLFGETLKAPSPGRLPLAEATSD